MTDAAQLCRECGTMVGGGLTSCPNCGADLAIEQVFAEKSNGKGSAVKTGCLVIGGIFLALVILGALIGGPDENTETGGCLETEAPTDSAVTADAAEPEIDTSESPSLTGPQRNAQRSASQYLSMTGFSRAGLIEQLSSPYGDGYSVSDATVAVDTLDVDWNEQAVRSARQYLSMTGFSCNGLIEQLSSSAGDKYSAAEARFGAEQAGAC